MKHCRCGAVILMRPAKSFIPSSCNVSLRCATESNCVNTGFSRPSNKGLWVSYDACKPFLLLESLPIF